MPAALLSKAVLLWAIAFAITTPAQAQPRNPYTPELTEAGRRISAEIYSLNYEKAAASAKALESAFPDDPLGPALGARVLWSRQLAAERNTSLERFSHSDFFSRDRTLNVPLVEGVEQQFREATARAIEKATVKIRQNPKDWAAHHSLALAYQHLAAFEFSVKRRWWAAYRTGGAMFETEKAVAAAVPEFADARFAEGVSQYLGATLPASVRLFAVLFGFRGNRQAGLEILERVAREGIFNADDARTILAALYAREKEHRKSIEKLRELHTAYPGNYLVALELGGVLLGERRYEEALGLYRLLLAQAGREVPGYQPLQAASVWNRIGIAQRMKGDLEQSAASLSHALERNAVPGLIRSVSLLELGKTLDLQKKREEATLRYRAVLADPDVAGCHKEARALLARSYVAEVP